MTPYCPSGYLAPTYCPPILVGVGLADPPDTFVQAVAGYLIPALVPASLTWFGLGDPESEHQPLPYGGFTEPDEADSYWTSGGDGQADGHLQISIYAATKDQARLLGDRTRRLLDDAPLLFTGGHLVYLRQSSRSAALDPDPAPGGGDCWSEVRLFRFICSSPPGGS